MWPTQNTLMSSLQVLSICLCLCVSVTIPVSISLCLCFCLFPPPSFSFLSYRSFVYIFMHLVLWKGSCINLFISVFLVFLFDYLFCLFCPIPVLFCFIRFYIMILQMPFLFSKDRHKHVNLDGKGTRENIKVKKGGTIFRICMEKNLVSVKGKEKKIKNLNTSSV